MAKKLKTPKKTPKKVTVKKIKTIEKTNKSDQLQKDKINSLLNKGKITMYYMGTSDAGSTVHYVYKYL